MLSPLHIAPEEEGSVAYVSAYGEGDIFVGCHTPAKGAIAYLTEANAKIATDSRAVLPCHIEVRLMLDVTPAEVLWIAPL